jgi:hypothetical protein
MAEHDDLLELILGNLDRGDAPDSKFPDASGEYWPLCPFHQDNHHGSFSLGEQGYKCFSCGAQGSLSNLAKHLGCEVAGLHGGSKGTSPASPSLTLEEYAKHKHLPQDFLEDLGLSTIHLIGKPVVKMPYRDEKGDEVSARFRLSLDGKKDRFRWRKGSKAMPYGLEKLNEASKAGYVTLVEGESDTQTLWHHGLPALGVPGATIWKPEWAKYVVDLAVYIWQEPDSGGAEFVKKIGETLPDALVITPPDGRKDVSACHILGDDIPTLMRHLMDEAVPYREIKAEEETKQAAEARSKATGLLHCPDILGEFEKLCEELGLAGERRNARILYLAVTSRLLKTITSVVVKGPSSGGKTFLVDTVLEAFPASAFYALTSMSERALAYSEEPLRHRMLVLYEVSGLASDFQSYLVRSLLSEGHIRYETVVKTPDGPAARFIEREGPTGLIVTTTQTSLHPENETRMLSLAVRDDSAQTKHVLHALANQVNGGSGAKPNLTAWHALQTWLELAGVREVCIPYARRLADLANPQAVRLRRDFSAVLNLIQAHAILHQEHRERDEGRIVASLEDYRVVHSLVSDLICEGVRLSVKQTVRETVEAVEHLRATDANRPVTVAQVAQHLRLDRSSAHRRAREAMKDGYLVNLEHRKGCPAKLELGDPMPVEMPVLPEPDELEAEEGGEDIPPVPGATVQPSEPLRDGMIPRPQEQPLFEDQDPAGPLSWVGMRVKIEDLADFRERRGIETVGSEWSEGEPCPVVYCLEA